MVRPRNTVGALGSVLALLFLLIGVDRSLGSATLSIQTATIMHDGRSVLIEASASISGASMPLAAVDWEPGWHNSASATLTVARTGSSTFSVPLVFTGAPVRVQSSSVIWIIYAWIADPSDVVIGGDTVTLAVSSGWVRDSAGNTLGSATSQSVTNYSLVGTDGFIDESRFTFSDEVFVNLDPNGPDRGDDQEAGNPPPDPADVWEDAHHQETPLLTLRRALQLHHLVVNHASACAIRVKRGTAADTDTPHMSIQWGGTGLTSPMLISTYGTGNTRPIIRCPGTMAGLERGNASSAQYVYINGIHLQRTGTDDTYADGFADVFDDSHIVISDCKIEGFYHNIVIQYNDGSVDPSQLRWWSIFRNILLDAHDNGGEENDRPQGIYSDHCQQGLLISQNVLDRNGWRNNAFDRTNEKSHGMYLNTNRHAVGGFVWGNLVARSGASGCQNRPGGVIYGNVFAENAAGAFVGGHDWQGGGRLARNYFEAGRDVLETIGTGTVRHTLGWGPGLAGNQNDMNGYGPSIVELNCVVNATGTGPETVWIDRNGSTLFGAPEAIVRNNTGRANGFFQISSLMTDDAQPLIESSRNIWDAANTSAGSMVAMNLNGWPYSIGSPIYVADYNVYTRSSSSNVVKGGTTEYTISGWRSQTGQEANSMTSSPTYPSGGADYDLGDYASYLGFPGTGQPADYYAAVAARALGDNDPDLLDFVSAAAFMIGKREEIGFSIPWPSSDPLNFWGSGDGHDPQIP